MRFYLDRKSDKGVRAYTYLGTDISWGGRKLQPLWEWVTIRLPKTLAPNTLTFISLSLMFIAFVLFVFSHEKFESSEEEHYLIYFVSSLLVFVYQNSDAIDGKLARLINSETAMGELFDHGGDSYALVFLMFIMAYTLNLGSTLITWFFFASLFFSSFLTLWEEYVTLHLRFNFWNSVTEVMLLAELALIITPITGSWIWKYRLFNLISVVDFGIILVVTVAPFANFFGAIQQNIQYFRNKPEEVKKRNITQWDMWITIYPVFYFFIIFTIWLFLDYSFIIEDCFVLFCFIYGITLAYLQNRMILNRISHQKPRKFLFIIVPITVVFLILNFVLVDLDAATKRMWIVGLCVIVVLFVLHFLIITIWELRDALGIYVFKPATIKRVVYKD